MGTAKVTPDWDEVGRHVRFLRCYRMNLRTIGNVLGFSHGQLRSRSRMFALDFSERVLDTGRGHSVPINTGAAAFARSEAERIAANRGRDVAPGRVLSAEDRARIAAENAAYVPITRRVPARGVRGWSAVAAVNTRSPEQQAQTP